MCSSRNVDMYTISKQNVDAKRNKNQFYHDLNLVAISLMLPMFSKIKKRCTICLCKTKTNINETKPSARIQQESIMNITYILQKKVHQILLCTYLCTYYSNMMIQCCVLRQFLAKKQQQKTVAFLALILPNADISTIRIDTNAKCTVPQSRV